MIWTIIIITFGIIAAEAGKSVEPEFLDELFASGEDEKLAALLGIDKSLIRRNKTEQRAERPVFNHASFKGDILLTEEQVRNALNFTTSPESRWPNGRIPFVISKSFSMSKRSIIRRAIMNFNSKTTNLKIVPRRRENDYVFVMNGNGCYSFVGRIEGQQALSLDQVECLTNGIVQHQFIHAAGFDHEHNRADRDNYVKVLFDNIPEEYHVMYEKRTEPIYQLIGRYDYYSIMHYPIQAPETGLDAFEILRSGIDRNRLGQEEGVTDTDVNKIDRLYEG